MGEYGPPRVILLNAAVLPRLQSQIVTARLFGTRAIHTSSEDDVFHQRYEKRLTREPSVRQNLF